MTAYQESSLSWVAYSVCECVDSSDCGFHLQAVIRFHFEESERVAEEEALQKGFAGIANVSGNGFGLVEPLKVYGVVEGDVHCDDFRWRMRSKVWK